MSHDVIDPLARAPVPDSASAEILDASGTAPAMPAAAVAPVTLFVCTTCKAADAAPEATPAGAVLHEAVQGLAEGDAMLEQVAVRPVKCLGNCKRGLSAALIHRDGWTYVFGDLTSESAEDLLTGARLFLTTTDGILPWRGRPDVLKRNMVARVPPLNVSPAAS